MITSPAQQTASFFYPISVTVEKDIASQIAECDKKGAAKIVGKVVAERAIAAGIKEVVFDRGGYIYTGRVAELAAGAREGGLDF